MGYTTDDRHFRRLSEVVDWSYRRQREDRRIHRALVRYLAGEYYPADLGSAGPKTPIPLLSMASRAMSRHLISKAPRAMVTPRRPQLKTWAENGELSVNERIRNSNVGAALRDVVNQSMVSFGVLFFAPQYVGTKDGMKLDLAVESIDRADFGYDLESASLEHADLQYHKIRMKLADAREHPLFDERARAELQGDGTASDAQEDVANLRSGLRGGRPFLYEHVEIWCVYDRPRQKLVYFPRWQPQMRLMEADWLGPVRGPYRYLYYETLPGQAVPVAPLVHLLTKHKAFNVLDMKAIHQQQAAKGVLAYTNAAKSEAEEIVNAVVNQSVLQENGSVRYLQMGGAAPDTVAMAEKQRKDFSYASSGIVDQFLQQAGTLGQERLLRGASNETLDDMAGWAYQFVKGLCEDFFFFDLHDPDPEPMMLRRQVSGSALSYEVAWTADHRRMMQQFQWDVDVEPYSYVERSPETHLADLLGALQILAGLADQAAAQGITIDVREVVEAIARLKNLPQLKSLLVMDQDPRELAQIMGAGGFRSNGGLAEPSVRRYERRSVSDGAGADIEMMRMMGRGSGGEMAA